MDLLKYEFMDSPEGSYNYELGQLIASIRHYNSSVPAEEFRNALPGLKKMESKLHRLEDQMGIDTRRNYITETMDELARESEIEGNLIEEITRCCNEIVESSFEKTFIVDDFNFIYLNRNAVNRLIFYGYTDTSIEMDLDLSTVTDVFRSVCNKYAVIFIDYSKYK